METSKSQCGVCDSCHAQDQDFFTTDIDTEEIEKNPGLACKKCYQLWKNLKLK